MPAIENSEAQCPSLKIARELAAVARVRTDNELEQNQVSDRFDDLRDQLSWSTPRSHGGALAHLVCASAFAELFPMANHKALGEKWQRAMERHLYALQAFLIDRVESFEPDALEALLREMPPANDPRRVTEHLGVPAPVENIS